MQKSSATAPPTTRLQRGVRLFRERGHEIERIGINTYRAPSCTGEDSYRRMVFVAILSTNFSVTSHPSQLC